MSISASPFHLRAAAANLNNHWASRGALTLSRTYTDAGEEALAARFRVGLSDISWRWRIMLEGEGTEEFLARLATFEPAAIEPGRAVKALWLNDAGGVRGTGVFARHGRSLFELISASPDHDWIARAALHFGVSLCRPKASGGLALLGPYAAATLVRAGLDASLAPLCFRKLFWRGIEITLSRFGEFNGYEIWCDGEDALLVWDRLRRAGTPFGLLPVGLDAADLLDLEAGIARPGRDYLPARSEAEPGVATLSLEGLIYSGAQRFNGRAAYMANRGGPGFRLAGVEIEGDVPAPFTSLMLNGKAVGHTLSSAVSPNLRRAIALASVERSVTAGAALSLTLPPMMEHPELRIARAYIVDLPFLPAPEAIAG